MDKSFPGQAPGLLYVNSKLTEPEEFSPEDFNKWYSTVHIPDVLKTSGVNEASRWQSLDPNGERPYLAFYPLQDIKFPMSDEFKSQNKCFLVIGQS